jgi:hypothetical protein
LKTSGAGSRSELHYTRREIKTALGIVERVMTGEIGTSKLKKISDLLSRLN